MAGSGGGGGSFVRPDGFNVGRRLGSNESNGYVLFERLAPLAAVQAEQGMVGVEETSEEIKPECVETQTLCCKENATTLASGNKHSSKASGTSKNKVIAGAARPIMKNFRRKTPQCYSQLAAR